MSRHHTARLKTAQWARVRRAVFERDKYRCRACGRPGRLECDHLVPLHRDRRQDPYDVARCQTLCAACHVSKTRGENCRPRTPDGAKWQQLVAEISHRGLEFVQSPKLKVSDP